MFTSTTTGRALASAALAASAVAGLAACGTVAPRSGVEQQITSQLAADTATCPGDLDAEVGKTMTCKATGGGESFDVTVTVTSLQGSDINFDIARVGAAPTGQPAQQMTVDAATGAVDGQAVATAVSEKLTAIAGQTPDSVTCPDLPASVGSTIRCELVAGPDTLGVTVTTTAVQDGRVQFDIKVDDTPS
jgi:hypothetical protein